jgi:glucokinase
MHDYCRVGIDIGGTGVKGVAITEQGKALASFDVPTSNFDDSPIEILINQVKKILDTDYPLFSIGIGASGPVNLKTFLINNQDTLPSFTGIDLFGSLSAAF